MTRMELIVLKLMVEGLSTQEIADRRGITVGVIDMHIRNLQRKVSAKTRFQLGYIVGQVQAPWQKGEGA